MRLKDLFSGTKKLGKLRVGERIGVMAMLLVFLFSMTVPQAYAAATEVKANSETASAADTPMKQNYPDALPVTDSKNQPAADYTPKSTATNVPGVTNTGAGTSQNDVVETGQEADPKVVPGELTDKRTANSATFRNANGSFTTKQYSESQFYQKDGSKNWLPIDTTLVEDKNAGDASNPLAKLWGQVESAFNNTTTYTVRANSWFARFAPSDFNDGMVRIKQGDSQIGYAPVGANSVVPTITTNDGKQTVRYNNLWDGVDVEYVVTADQVKESIILKNKDATNQVQFKLLGASLQQTNDRKGAQFKVSGALDNNFSILPANLILNNFGLETDHSKFSQTYKDGILTEGIDKDYLSQLPTQAFPAVIDPTTVTQSYIGDRTSGNYLSYKSDGYICYSNECNLYAGSLLDTNSIWQNWRGEFFAPYDFLKGKTLSAARLHLTKRDASFYTGTTSTQTFTAYKSTCHGYDCLGTQYASASIATSGDMDLTSLYNSAVSAGNWEQWVIIKGTETTATTFKNFDPDHASTYVEFTYTDTLPAPVITTPAQNQVFTDPQVSFATPSYTNPNTGGPMQYSFCVSTGPSCNGAVIVSPPQSRIPAWTVPDGILQDGTSYYVQARTYDPSNGVYSSYGASVPFRIDSRTGKDSTQAYDTAGPVSVDLATGNVSTSASSHASTALGGDLGVGLDYNSPVRSRNGLIGQYYNNTSWSGTPALTRVDQNVSFDWGDGSPSSSVITGDAFSAKWTGYFVAPTSGTYYFGSRNDDNTTITINGTQVLNIGNCYSTSAACYGSSVTLTAGQAVPLTVTLVENGGNSLQYLYVKGAVSEQIVPNTWLQTGVRDTTQQYGLTGYYYNDNGTHSFTDSANTMFMQRVDPMVSFDWGRGAAAPGGPSDNFMARWTGYITVPTTGTYYFGSISDDGSRVYIGNNTSPVFNKWSDDAGSEQYGSAVTLTAGVPTAITVDYYDHTSVASMFLKIKGAVAQQVVPSTWLSPKAQVLPAGWNLGVDADGNAAYDHLKASQNSVVLTDSSGGTHEYKWTNGSYTPPAGEDGTLVRNNDGTFNFQDSDGRTYVFNTDGTLQSLTNPTDDTQPAALQYAYSGSPSKLTQITDGVNANRWAKLYYSGDTNCGTAPTSFDAQAPTNMLCALKTNDGRFTYFYYRSGNLARIQKPGNEITDYGYDTLGRITSIRDSVASDAIAAGVRTDDNTANTELVYDAIGRLSSVTQPAPTAGASRSQDTFNYYVGLNSSYYGATEEHVVGASEPNGFTRRVEYDNLFRTLKDTDVAGLSTATEWDINKDLVLSITDPTGLKSTTIYDDEDRAVSQYGPAPAAWYNTWAWKLAAGQQLTPGQSIKSYDGRFTLLYQSDGNIVLYGPSGAMWSTGTDGKASTHFTMQTNGNLVLYNGTTAIWTSGTAAASSDSTIFLALQNDGNLVSYGYSGSQTIWQTRTTGGIGNPSANSYNKPLSTYTNQVPHSDTAYDQNMQGPAVAYYTLSATNKVLTGAPKVHSTNIKTPTSSGEFSSSSTQPINGVTDNWGLRATGKMRLPTTGQYTFRIYSDGGVRFYLDDQIILDDWNDGSARNHPDVTFNNIAGTVHRFRVEYYHKTGSPAFTFHLTPPGGSDTTMVNQYISPDYSLVTSTTAYDATLGNTTMATGYGSNPELGLAQSQTVDPSGLALASTSSYEALGASGSYLRQTSKTSPGGATTTYTYYSASNNIDNPCTTGTDLKYQAGKLRLKTEMDPDGNGTQTSKTTEYVYDNAGRPVATRVNDDAWTCTTYDARGRVAQVVIPDVHSRTGRTVTYNYSVGGNPLIISQTDSLTGTLTNRSDLLGRNVGATDTFGYDTTITYDSLGRVITKTSQKGTETVAYDSLNRIASYQLDGVTYATLTYDQYSRIATVDYPQAQNGSSNLKLTQVKRDAAQAEIGSTYTFSDGSTYDETVARSAQTGIVTGDTITQGGKTASTSYQYDAAGRLTGATVDNWQYQYGFGTQDASCSSLSGANANAGKGGNRTSYVVTNTQTNTTTNTVNCYNVADQLISSTDAQVGTPTYDDHGNITQFAGGGTPITFTYSADDQNTAIQQGQNRVEYTKSPDGSVLTRKEYQNGTLTKLQRNTTGVMLSCDLVNQTQCTTTDRYLTLPGGVQLTLTNTNQSTVTPTYSIQNFHGDTAITVGAAGTPTSSVYMYDPFGQSVNSATFGTSGTPNNASGLGMGWATNPSRKTESMFSLAVMQMGARVYIPTLGRFAQTDPVDGGTPNAYTYVLDPVNFADYSGQWGFHLPKWVKTVAKIVVAIVVVAVVAVVAVAALPEEVVAAIGAGAVAAARAVAAGASWAANRGSSIVSGAAKAVSAGSKGTNAASTAVRAMPRADPGRITAVGSKAAPLVNRAESGLLGNTPTTIAGRWYSGHALNGMQNTGIYPSVVENTVKFGKLVESSRADTYKFYDAENDISVILNASGGVVTTFYGK